MAFPIPAHLPRKKDQDVSTKLLSEISETSFKSLSQEVASKWVAELNVAIRETKDEIHNRIHSNISAFDQQLSSSKYVQERLQALETNVDKLSDTLSHPETGLVPNLIATLTRHANLTQDAADAEVMHQAMSHLAHCKREMQSLAALVGAGRLPDAVALCVSLEGLIANSPPPLPTTQVLGDIRRRFRALKDRSEEQLHEAYSRGVMVTTNEIIIRPSVQVRASEHILSLAEILSSLSPASVASLSNTLRRDLASQYIDRLLTQPASVEQSAIKHLAGTSELKLTVFPSPPNTEELSSRVDNLSNLITFLNENLLPHFPSSAKLPASLNKPLTTALLDKLLIPSLPSSNDDLPGFLSLMQRAVKFEQDFIVDILGHGRADRDIYAWSSGIAGHHERKKRVDILERARTVILQPEDEHSSFRVEVQLPAVQSPTIEVTSIVQSEPSQTFVPEDSSAWGFDDAPDEEPSIDEDGWGFEDEVASEEVPTPEPVPEVRPEDDSDDAWGWNNGAEHSTAEEGDGHGSSDSSVWDDPWGDVSESTPAPAPTSKAVKTASRLERLSNKGKTLKSEPPVQSPIPVPPPPPTPAMPSSVSRKAAPQPLQPVVEKETYLVSGRAKELMFLVEDVLQEAAALQSSGVFASYSHEVSQVGALISSSAPSVLDLYRALYPVRTGSTEAGSTKRAIAFSNNSIWLQGEVMRITTTYNLSSTIRSKLEECAERLGAVGELWFEEAIDAQCQKLNVTLDSTEGFVGTENQDRYDECEAAVNRVLQDIRRFSQQLKPLLPKSRYYQAIGSAVDAALSRILKDVLALPDITETESHKLNELCLIMNALEGLFVEDSNVPSFVVAYVPSWLKFSYLSELLEASIADISYLFEEGALVDFQIDELVNLVRALFADTPLRTSTIHKLLQGHPIPSS